MPQDVSKLRIFVASPGDVTEERELLARVVEHLRSHVAAPYGLELELVRWETHMRPGAGVDAQAVVNPQIGAYDLFIGILWNRFGTPTGRAESGTREEFDQAYARWQKDPSGLEIWVYFSKQPFNFTSPQELEQKTKVLAFKQELQTVKGLLTWEYANPDDFAEQVRGHLELFIPKHVPQAKPASHLGPLPPSSIAPTKLHAGYLRRVQTTCNALPLAVIDPRAVERTRQQTMDLLAVYVDLNTQTPVPLTEEERTDKKRARRAEMPDAARETRFLTALESAARERQMVLLGDPGGGKSTFANYLALCLAGAQLETLGETGALPGENWLKYLQPAWTHGALLPLQIVLRHFAKSDHCDGTAAGLWNFIAQTLDAQSLADYAPHLHQCLHDGGVLVLLDGLDEVADVTKSQAVRDAVREFAKTYSANRFLVTCRGYAYQDARWQLDRFAVYTLAAFDQEQIDAFIGCWYKEVCRLGWKSETEAEELTRRLQEATRRTDLAPLAKNPLQLAMMASLHFSWGRLPDDRVELYQEMVRLLLVRWQEARLGQETGVTQLVRAGELESALERVAFVAHKSQQGTEGAADISEVMLRSVFKDCLEGSWDRAGEMVTFIQDRAGLLIDRGKGTYTFPHRSYQEYLAGSYLAVQPDFPDQVAELVRANYAQWREVALWAVEVMARLKKMVHVAVDVAAALCPHDAPGAHEPEIEWRAAHLAGEALVQIGLERVNAHQRHSQVVERARRWLVALLERGALTPADRAAAGRTLALLGDPRPGIGVTPFHLERSRAESKEGEGLGERLPDIVWCQVPAGEFVMGTRKEDIPALMKKYGGERDWYDWETPQLKLNLPAFLIAKYPLTNAQFDAFAQADGYRDAQYWQEAIAQGWWQTDGFKGRYDKQPRERPYDFGAPFNLPNHPVVGITWYEVLAFCRWLTERFQISEFRFQIEKVVDRDLQSAIRNLQFAIRLPTEAEWEKAARGPSTGAQDDGRIFPWQGELTPQHANYGEANIGATSAVGSFPLGASPCGALDLSGNVWEWCSTKWIDNYKDYAKRAKERESLEGPDSRVVRGGSWGDYQGYVRAAARVGPTLTSGTRTSVVGWSWRPFASELWSLWTLGLWTREIFSAGGIRGRQSD